MGFMGHQNLSVEVVRTQVAGVGEDDPPHSSGRQRESERPTQPANPRDQGGGMPRGV